MTITRLVPWLFDTDSFLDFLKREFLLISQIMYVFKPGNMGFIINILSRPYLERFVKEPCSKILIDC